jgi:hypothetical protein
MSSAARMSALVMGQVGRRFSVTMRMKTLVLGGPILICRFRAVRALRESALLYLVLFCVAVVETGVGLEVGTVWLCRKESIALLARHDISC